MEYIKARLHEPSTWAGLGVLYVALEALVGSGNYAASLPAVLGAVIAILKGDGKVA